MRMDTAPFPAVVWLPVKWDALSEPSEQACVLEGGARREEFPSFSARSRAHVQTFYPVEASTLDTPEVCSLDEDRVAA